MPAGDADHIVGHGCNDDGSDVLSPQEDERRLAKLVAIVRDMIDRWEETARRTPRALLCRLRSTNPNTCYPKPFTLVSLKTSKTKYARLFQRFVAFLFRYYRMPSRVGRRLCKIRFTKRQREQL